MHRLSRALAGTLLLALTSPAVAAPIVPSGDLESLLGQDGGGDAEVHPDEAPAQVPVPSMPRPPVAEGDMKTMIAADRAEDTDARQRAHVWALYEALLAPTSGGAAFFELLHSVEETFDPEDGKVPMRPASTPAGFITPRGLTNFYDPSAHAHIRMNKLFLQSTHDNLRLAGTRGIPEFPNTAVVLKSSWDRVDPARFTDAMRRTRYWIRKKDGYYLLTGLHVTTKEIKNWMWGTLWFPQRRNDPALTNKRFADGRPASFATWRHVADDNGRSVPLEGVFANYVMDLTMDFFDVARDGTKTDRVCFNPNIETFGRSNCMSCHQAAGSGSFGFPFFGELPDDDQVFTEPTPVGTTGQLRPALRTDFLWSIPFRGR